MHILLYHGVSRTIDGFERVFQKHILVEQFREQIDYVQQHYTILSIGEFLHRWETRTLRDTDALITFDDCYKNVMNAAHILADRKIPALFAIGSDMVDRNYSWTDDIEKVIVHTPFDRLQFRDFTLDLSTEQKRFKAILFLKDYFKNLFVDQNKVQLQELISVSGVDPSSIRDTKFDMISWDDVRALQRVHGFTITHHSHGHYPMSKYRTLDEVRSDVATGVQRIRTELGMEPHIFMYPFGGVEHYDDRTKLILKELGFQFAFAVNNQPVDHADPYEICRVELTLPRFESFIRL